jgi:hypothetical protein
MAAAAAEPNGASIEDLFRPSTRFRDSHRNRHVRLPEGWTEIELLPHLTPLDILATCVTWDEFLIFLQNKIVWMTPDVYVCNNMYLGGISDKLLLRLGGNAGTSTTSLRVYVTPNTAAALATATCDFAVRLFATCERHDLCIEGGINPPLSGAVISLFFQESRSCLRKVRLDYIALSEDHCRALATMSRLDVELNLVFCSLSNDAAGAFVECLQSDRGPIQLIRCKIDSQIFASALVGKSRVTKLKPASGANGTTTNEAVLAVLFTALANNRSLLDLDLSNNFRMNDDSLSILCESLKAHPTLIILELPNSPFGLSDKRKANRMRMLAEMVQQNTVLHTIRFSEHEQDEQIYTQEICPYLEVNLYRPRVLAVKKTTERPFREKVLGRALHCVKSSPNLVWMFLSENVDAFARSEEEESNDEVAVAVAVAVAVEEAVAVACSKRKR